MFVDGLNLNFEFGSHPAKYECPIGGYGLKSRNRIHALYAVLWKELRTLNQAAGCSLKNIIIMRPINFDNESIAFVDV